MVVTPTPLENIHSKYHIVGVEERCINNNNFGKEDCGDDEDCNDDDCIVLLPGEEDSSFQEAVELESNFNEPVESDSDSNNMFRASNKRRRVGV